jgi:glutamate-1-semialdehyde aminotransferase
MQQKKKKKINISDEERERRRQRAKEMVKKGVIGGDRRSEGAGRPKVKKATEKVAEEADRNAAKMVKELKSILENGKPSEKLKAIDLWLSIAIKEQEKQDKKELEKIKNATREELIQLVGQQIIPLLQSGIKIPGLDQIEEVITVEAEEIKDE